MSKNDKMLSPTTPDEVQVTDDEKPDWNVSQSEPEKNKNSVCHEDSSSKVTKTLQAMNVKDKFPVPETNAGGIDIDEERAEGESDWYDQKQYVGELRSDFDIQTSKVSNASDGLSQQSIRTEDVPEVDFSEAIHSLDASNMATKQRKPEGYDQLISEIFRICSSVDSLICPMVMPLPDDYSTILVQSPNILTVKHELENLTKISYPSCKIKVSQIPPISSTTPEKIPIYAEPLSPTLQGPFHLHRAYYENERGYSNPRYVATIGLFVRDNKYKFFAITAGHAVMEEEDTNSLAARPLDTKGIIRVAGKVTGRVTMENLTTLKAANSHPVELKSSITLISYQQFYQANSFDGIPQDTFFTDIALLEVDSQKLNKWVTLISSVDKITPLQKHHGTYPQKDGSYCSPQTPSSIAGILTITNEQDVRRLIEKKVHIFIHGRGDIVGTICYGLELDNVNSSFVYNRDRCILFTTNGIMLKPGDSGSGVMVRNTETGNFYLVGILHGKLNVDSKVIKEEIYIATVLSISLKKIESIYSPTRCEEPLRLQLLIENDEKNPDTSVVIDKLSAQRNQEKSASSDNADSGIATDSYVCL